MRIIAAGTGPPAGLPVPACPCATCRSMRRAGTTRAPLRLQAGTRTLTGAAEWAGDGVLWVPDAGALDTGALDRSRSSGPHGGQILRDDHGPVELAFIGPGKDGDLACVARLVSWLRRSGQLSDDAECVLVGATHDSPRDRRRSLLLAAWGLSEASDGQVWTVPAQAGAGGRGDVDPAAVDGERVLVIGGARSGKSQLAEDLVLAHPAVTYIATGPAAEPDQDAGWAARVQRHRSRRPSHWTTVETLDLATALTTDQPVLVDSLGSWLTRILDRADAWNDASGWRTRVDDDIAALAAAWRSRAGSAVAVTDEAGWGVVPGTSSGRLFRDLLGQLNQAIAQQSDRVLVVVAGQVLEATDGGCPGPAGTVHDVGRG